MENIERNHYGVILADCPWSFKVYGKDGHKKSAERHYDTMTLDDIKAMPVGDLALKDCWLIMWTTWPCLPQCIDVIKEWGFTYKSGGAWAKQSKTGRAWQFGTGYIFRSATEPLLVASRGNPKWLSKSERNLWVAPIREHSRKPELIHEMIERSCAGPYLELFARSPREGWDVWGNDTEHFIRAYPVNTHDSTES